MFVFIISDDTLEKWRYAAFLGAITSMFMAPVITNRLNSYFGVIRFFFTIVPSFAVGIVTYT